eukprot:6460732-Prymnesium_polylepis.1
MTWPLNVFLRLSLKRSEAEYVVIWLSRFWQSIHLSLGVFVTAGIECCVGSAMCLIGTGMPYSQMSIFLSSAVVAKRRFSSQK